MMKAVVGFIGGMVVFGIVAWNMAGSMMLREVPSPYGVEETAARIQRNIQSLSGNGWSLSGLRNPAAAVAASGTNVPPVLLIEACSTKYSAPMLKDDSARILSILMPCTITVYKKDDGKTYIGLMNSGLMGRMFGPMVGAVMAEVAKDQALFVKFDPSRPAPPLIKGRPGGGGGAGGAAADGC
ncbi:MAG: DUF302 domain-containing protein [Gammaproteobacteria bacterium]|nr:DUF302 domain-containing protein [Gammaproteobacteria bacterium]